METLGKTAASVARVTRSRAAFDLKGTVASLTVLRLRSRDLNMIDRQLRAKVAQMPGFFQDAPVVVDLGGLEGGLAGLPIGAIIHMLRACRVVPVGVTNVSDEDRELARAAGVPVLQLGAARRDEPTAAAPATAPQPVAEAPIPKPPEPARAPRPEPARATAPAPDPHRPPLIVRAAVRSGQVVYARNTDLIVLAPVNPGAQLFADGHIHCYSTLRGRAMAGAQGYAEARLFVQKLEAELVAIAGAYLTADDIPESRRGAPAQIFLENGVCQITAL